MSTLREAAQQALEAMETVELDIEWRAASPTHKMLSKAITALRAALAEPVQEPVAWLRLRDGKLASNDGGNFGDDWTPLYTAPPQRRPLTDEEINALELPPSGTATVRDLVRLIERAHGIGGQP